MIDFSNLKTKNFKILVQTRQSKGVIGIKIKITSNTRIKEFEFMFSIINTINRIGILQENIRIL